MTYDAEHKAVLVFGGVSDGGGITAQTLWAWNGSRWTCLSDGGPPARIHAEMSYDAARHRLVLYGGRVRADNTWRLLHDTWEWDGSTWICTDTVGTGDRLHFAMEYDAADKAVVLHGGAGERDALHDTWRWTGTRWERVHTAEPPDGFADAFVASPRLHSPLVIAQRDSAMKGTGLFRAVIAVREGSAWRVVSSDGPLFSPQIPAAPTKNGIMLFAGWDPNAAPATTHLWNGTTWTRAVESPPRRRGARLAYDAARDRVVLFGGDTDAAVLGDVWEWDGAHWRAVSRP